MFFFGSPKQSSSEHRARYGHCDDIQAGDLVQNFPSVGLLWRRATKMVETETRREEGLLRLKVEKEESYFDWQLSGLVPAEVVPPTDCYYQQKDFPIALAATVSPLSPGGCYPIWEEMNRGPLTPYEVSVDRIFTEEAQWSKQTLCQHQHLQHLWKHTCIHAHAYRQMRAHTHMHTHRKKWSSNTWNWKWHIWETFFCHYCLPLKYLWFVLHGPIQIWQIRVSGLSLMFKDSPPVV